MQPVIRPSESGGAAGRRIGGVPRCESMVFDLSEWIASWSPRRSTTYSAARRAPDRAPHRARRQVLQQVQCLAADMLAIVQQFFTGSTDTSPNCIFCAACRDSTRPKRPPPERSPRRIPLPRPDVYSVRRPPRDILKPHKPDMLTRWSASIGFGAPKRSAPASYVTPQPTVIKPITSADAIRIHPAADLFVPSGFALGNRPGGLTGFPCHRLSQGPPRS